jgi:hypothetical protein
LFGKFDDSIAGGWWQAAGGAEPAELGQRAQLVRWASASIANCTEIGSQKRPTETIGSLGDSQNVHLRIVNPAARSVLATEFGVFVFKLPLEKW